MINKKIVSVAAILMLALGLVLKGKPANNQNGKLTLTKKTVTEWQKERADRMFFLFRVLTRADKESKFRASFLLGSHRFNAAVPVLASHIELEAPWPRKIGKIPRWRQYPAVEALIHIGKPSLYAMIDILKKSEDAHRRQLAAQVILGVEGPKTGRYIVKQAIAETENPAQKERLKESLALIHSK